MVLIVLILCDIIFSYVGRMLVMYTKRILLENGGWLHLLRREKVLYPVFEYLLVTENSDIMAYYQIVTYDKKLIRSFSKESTFSMKLAHKKEWLHKNIDCKNLFKLIFFIFWNFHLNKWIILFFRPYILRNTVVNWNSEHLYTIGSLDFFVECILCERFEGNAHFVKRRN